MKQIKSLAKNLWVIEDSTNIGVIQTQVSGKTNLYLIDSGASKEVAIDIYSTLQNSFKDFTLKAIINTHSHCDHCGGNAYFVEKTGCEIWATLGEKGSIETPILQSAVALGSYPLSEFQTNLFLAEPSMVTRTIKNNEKITLEDGVTLQFVPLPGHYIDMIGVLCSNENMQKAFFLGDSIFGRAFLGKYWIPFLFDVRDFVSSLEKINSIESNFYIPSHGDTYTEISALVEFNTIAAFSTETCIMKILETPHTIEELIKEVADKNNIPLRLSQFVLVGSTIRSYVSILHREKKISWFFKQNRMYWKISDAI